LNLIDRFVAVGNGLNVLDLKKSQGIEDKLPYQKMVVGNKYLKIGQLAHVISSSTSAGFGPAFDARLGCSRKKNTQTKSLLFDTKTLLHG